MNGKQRYHRFLARFVHRSASEYPKEALCPVCARVKVPFGKSCPHKSPDSWVCEELFHPVNAVQARYYVELWQKKLESKRSGVGLSEIAESSGGKPNDS